VILAFGDVKFDPKGRAALQDTGVEENCPIGLLVLIKISCNDCLSRESAHRGLGVPSL